MNAIPEITKADETSIRWTTPTFPSLVTRTIEIYKGGFLFRTDTLQSSGSATLSGLDAGTYKIRYKVNSNQEDFSGFSNEIQLVPQISQTPTVTSFEPRIKDDGFAVVTVTGVVGAFVVCKDINDFEAASATIYNADGTVLIGVSNSGTYTFVQTENGKSTSFKTASISILAKANACTGIFNLLIAGSGTEVANSTRVYRTSYQGSVPLSVSWSVSGQGTQIISGGNSQDAEIKIGNSGGTITASFVGCDGITVSKDYIYAIGTALPNCDNGLTSFFLGNILYDKTANTLNYSFNASNLATANWNIKQGSVIIQSGSATHNSNNKTITGVNTLVAGNYTFELIGTSCTGIATKPFTVVADTGGGLASCNNGTNAFAIISIVHNATANTLTYQFNASGLSGANWKIKQGVSVLGSGSVTHTSNIKTIPVASLPTGAYTFELTGTTCEGIAVKSFNAVLMDTGGGGGTGGTGGGATTKRVTAFSKFSDNSVCSINVIQFGYSGSASVIPTNFTDSNGTKRVENNNGVITEVQSGGTVYQSKDFDLPAGTYHFFSRQKGLASNVIYEGVISVTS